MLPDMAKDYNSAKSNTSTSVRKDEDEKGKLPAKAGAAGTVGAGIAGTGGADGGEAVAQSSSAGESSALLPGGGESSATLPGGGDPNALPGGGDLAELPGGGARGGESGSVTGGGGTTGLRTTLGLMKSGFTFATVIIVVLAAADVYKMYDDGITINLEDHITDADFRLTEDQESIVGDIAFDIPKMGYLEKSIKVLVHLRVLESDPSTEDDFNFDYTLGSGEQVYDKFVLNDLDPVTTDKIDKGEPLDIEYTVTITIVYLGFELEQTTSEIGTKTKRCCEAGAEF